MKIFLMLRDAKMDSEYLHVIRFMKRSRYLIILIYCILAYVNANFKKFVLSYYCYEKKSFIYIFIYIFCAFIWEKHFKSFL